MKKLNIKKVAKAVVTGLVVIMLVSGTVDMFKGNVDRACLTVTLATIISIIDCLDTKLSYLIDKLEK